MDRRGFLKSFSAPFAKKEDQKKENVIRPPYNLDASLFGECAKCEEKPCVNVCEENIIKIGGDLTPYLDFSKRGCTFCDECADACEQDVLSLKENIKPEIEVDISIDMLKCVSWNGVICYSCKDVCYDDAIKFLGVLRPEIVSDKCTGCGFCIGVCPVNAVKIKGR